MTKIELACSNCQTLLGVESENAGKQVRCPNCGSLTQIPHSRSGQSTADDDSIHSKAAPPAPGYRQAANSGSNSTHKRDTSDNDQNGSDLDAANPAIPAREPLWNQSAAISLLCGIAGVGGLWFCSFVVPIFAVVGLVYGMQAGRYRKIALGMNALTLGISVLWLWFLFG